MLNIDVYEDLIDNLLLIIKNIPFSASDLQQYDSNDMVYRNFYLHYIDILLLIFKITNYLIRLLVKMMIS